MKKWNACLVVAASLLLFSPVQGLQAQETTATPENKVKLNRSISGVESFENTEVASGSVFRATSRKSELVFNGQSIFRGAYAGGAFGARVTVKVASGVLLFDGKYDAARSGGDKGFFLLEDKTRLIFGGNAQLNQQMRGMIMARPIMMQGKGPNSIIEFDAKFNADHMGWPDLEKMRSNGFSVLYVKDARMITHATQSLPSVHKISGNGNHTHHGVLIFQGDQAIWDLKTEVQEYDGVLGFYGKTRINTETDMIFTGHFFEDSHCYFGSWGGKQGKHELIKEGQGKLVILGTQLYGAPFVTRVKSGEVVYRTQTGHPGHYVKTEHPGRDWAQLELIVEKDGSAKLIPPMKLPTELKSLNISGQVIMGEGPLLVRDSLSMTQNAKLQLPVAISRSKKGNKMPLRVKVGGQLQLGGTIRVTGPSAKGSYLLMKADKITGKAKWEVPRGMVIELTETEVRLVSAQ